MTEPNKILVEHLSAMLRDQMKGYVGDSVPNNHKYRFQSLMISLSSF